MGNANEEPAKILLDKYFPVVSRKLTKEDKEEISRELAEYRAAHPKTPAAKTVSA